MIYIPEQVMCCFWSYYSGKAENNGGILVPLHNKSDYLVVTKYVVFL